MKVNYTCILELLCLLFLSSCSQKTLQEIEVTRLVPQFVEVTRIVHQTVIAAQSAEATSTRTPASTNNSETITKMDIDPAYYDGIIVIAQYYTYLDLGMYENAYQLLHSARPNPQSLEYFLLGAERAYKSVEIRTIQPYNEWARQHGIDPSIDPEGQKRFYVEIIVEGEEGWWLDKEVHFVFILADDHSKWRIFSQDTIAKK